MESNRNFADALKAAFGSRFSFGVSTNDFKSVQAGAGQNAMPMSEMEKKQKEKQKLEGKKKRKKALGQADAKDPVMPKLDNKTPSANLGTLKIGINLNNNSKPKSDSKQSSTAGGLNVYR
jgi:hypothetical protein